MKVLNKTQLKKAMDQISIKGRFDKSKINSADVDFIQNLTENLVRMRLPLIIDLVNRVNDTKFRPWLYSMGYSHIKEGKIFTFLCTCENQFNIK